MKVPDLVFMLHRYLWVHPSFVKLKHGSVRFCTVLKIHFKNTFKVILKHPLLMILINWTLFWRKMPFLEDYDFIFNQRYAGSRGIYQWATNTFLHLINKYIFIIKLDFLMWTHIENFLKLCNCAQQWKGMLMHLRNWKVPDLLFEIWQLLCM